MLDGTNRVIVLIVAIISLVMGIHSVRHPGWYESLKWKSRGAKDLSDSHKGLCSIGGVTLIIAAIALLGLAAFSWIGDISAQRQRAASFANLEPYEPDIATGGDLEPYEYDPNIATDGNLYGYDGGSEIATGGNLQ